MSSTTQTVIDGAAELFQLFATSRPPLNTDITVTCDALVHKIKMWDPDSGWWKYGYDKVGNLIHQEDPKAGQHVQFCYDAINRVTKKQYFTTDSYAAGWCSQTVAQQISSFYDAAAVAYSVGRLTTVNDLSGGTLYQQYDVRGRARWIDKQLTVNGHATTATTLYEYDRADHVWKITYPDNPAEQVVYGVNAEGKVVSLQNASGSPTYLSDLWYDVFGRPTKITHGNGTTDTRTYGNQTANFRLASIATTQGSTYHLNLSYASYTKTGLLTQLTDLHNGSGDLSNTATFTYDGLGRLTAVTNNPYLNGAYCFDYLGNITRKEGTTFGYTGHKLSSINGSGAQVSHDANGNRTGKPGQTYGDDADDHLTSISAGGSVSEFYDYTGRQAARQVGSNWPASTRRTTGTIAGSGRRRLTYSRCCGHRSCG